MGKKVTLLTFLAFISRASAGNAHFQYWFQQYRHAFTNLAEGGLWSDVFDAYYRVFGNDDMCPANDTYLGCLSGYVVNCLLGNVSEVLKANMAAGGVLLGLLPTTLSLVGSSTTETGLLALKRPLLSLLPAAGSPVISPIRTFEFHDPVTLLWKIQDSIAALRLTPSTAPVVVILEYVFACATVVNLAVISWELCFKTFCTFAFETEFHPALWAFTAVLIHLPGNPGGQTSLQLQKPDELPFCQPRVDPAHMVQNTKRGVRAQRPPSAVDPLCQKGVVCLHHLLMVHVDEHSGAYHLRHCRVC
jgi:hypothetical protein